MLLLLRMAEAVIKMDELEQKGGSSPLSKGTPADVSLLERVIAYLSGWS